MEGEIGQEYNYLYTTKDLKCKPRDDRDPILLQGDLGKEYYPLRPHSGLPRNCVNTTPQRNPITGVGDFGSEPEYLPFQNRKGASNQQAYMRTDPITHTFPERGSVTRHSMRQFNERWIMRDPIRHRYGDDQILAEHRSSEMRHFVKNGSGHDLFYNSAKDLSNHTSATLPSRKPYVRRNPITGEGMRPEDYSDTAPVLGACYFRPNTMSIHHISPVNPVSKPTTVTEPRQSRSPVRGIPSQTLSKRAQPVAKSTAKKTSPVKKVIRPIRPATVERTGYARGSSSDDRGSQHSGQKNGTQTEPPVTSVIKPIKKVVDEPHAKSFFEEVQLATSGTMEEMLAPNHQTDSLTTPNESLDYSEAARSLSNESYEKPLEVCDEKIQQNELEQYPEVTSNNPVAMDETKEAFRTNLGQAVASSLYEELQAYDRGDVMSPTEPTEDSQQKSFVPFFMGAEEDSPVSDQVKSFEKIHEHHGETTNEAGGFTPEYEGEMLETPSVDHRLVEKSFNDYESAKTLSEPEDTQSYVDSIEQSNKC